MIQIGPCLMIGPALVVKMHSKLTDIMDIMEKQKQSIYYSIVFMWSRICSLSHCYSGSQIWFLILVIELVCVYSLDNQGAIALASNPVHHKGSKHSDVKYHYIDSGAPNDNFRKIIYSEDDLRSRIIFWKISCLPACPRIFELQKNRIIDRLQIWRRSHQSEAFR